MKDTIESLLRVLTRIKEELVASPESSLFFCNLRTLAKSEKTDEWIYQKITEFACLPIPTSVN